MYVTLRKQTIRNSSYLETGKIDILYDQLTCHQTNLYNKIKSIFKHWREKQIIEQKLFAFGNHLITSLLIYKSS